MPSHSHDEHHGHAHHGHGHRQAHDPANFDRAFVPGITLNIALVAVEAFDGWRVISLALLVAMGSLG